MAVNKSNKKPLEIDLQNIFTPISDKDYEKYVPEKREKYGDCPICRCGRGATLLVDHMLRDGVHGDKKIPRPHEIFLALANKGYKLKCNGRLYGKDYNPNEDPKLWVTWHIAHCRREAAGNYVDMLAARKEDEEIAKSLRKASVFRGYEKEVKYLVNQNETSSNSLDTHINVNSNMGSQNESIEPIEAVRGLTTPQELKDEFKDVAPAVLINKLRIIRYQQELYLAGKRDEPPDGDIRELNDMIKSLQKYVSLFE